ncbi:uncharacterized protein JCM6883_006634 [Sporobolomyces salmoneus]|uniref:uncharacterized protein n=1 Tax=Sporobolomyces salmoneus TaxID=183962 RepID=UPI00317EB521
MEDHKDQGKDKQKESEALNEGTGLSLPSSRKPSSLASSSTSGNSPWSSDYHEKPWISVFVNPALSTVPLSPGAKIRVTFGTLDGVNLVELKARLVGYSQLAYKERHEFLSVPVIVDPSLLDAPAPDSTGLPDPVSITITLPSHQTCSCASSPGGLLTLIPLPPSYESKGNRIEYVLEISGTIDGNGRSRDRKGKGKLKLFGNKLRHEKFEIPFQASTNSLYDPRIPAVRPLAPEETYRTYPISQESISGRKRITLVELQEPKDIGLATKVWNAKLILELASSLDSSTSPPRLRPSFKYTLLVSLGPHFPSSIPLLSSSLQIASTYTHFVLHRSTTLKPELSPRENYKRVIPLVHRQQTSETRRDPPDAGSMHRDQPGTIDGIYTLIKGEEGADGRREMFVKSEGEFEVRLPAKGVEDANDEERLVPIRTCQLEVRYDLTATFQFGSDYDSQIMLKSTNLPLHLEHDKITSVDIGDEPFGSSSKSSHNKSLGIDRLQALSPGPHSASVSCPPTSIAQSRTPNDLPAYEGETSSAAHSTRHEKRRSTSNDNLSTEVEPPAYTGATSSSAPGGDRVNELGEPPSWDETVREDMIDDWVAASVAFGEKGE